MKTIQGIERNAQLCRSHMHPIPTHVLAYWRGVQEKTVAAAEAECAVMDREEALDAAVEQHPKVPADEQFAPDALQRAIDEQIEPERFDGMS